MRTQTKKSKRKLVNDYISKYSPYEKTPNLGYNIAKIAQYAKEKGCSIAELTAQEIARFQVK